MNRTQKRVLWLGIAVVIVMLLFPPWTDHVGNPTGYGFLLTSSSHALDTGRLALQVLVVAVLTAAGMLSAKA